MAYINDSVINCFKKELCELEHKPDKFSRVKATFLKNNVIATLEGCKAADVEKVCHCGKCKYSKTHTCAITGIKTLFCDYGEKPVAVEPTHYCGYGESRRMRNEAKIN